MKNITNFQKKTSQRELEINLLGIRKIAMIYHFKGWNKNLYTLMIPITQEIEKELDKKEGGFYLQDKYNKQYIYFTKNIMYGDIDFNDKKDLDLIEKYDILKKDKGFMELRSNFDYEKGSHMVINDQVTTHNCCNYIEYFRYCHCLLGKPKKIAIFEMTKLELELLNMYKHLL